MRYFVILAFILALPCIGRSQVCNLNMDAAPDFRGIKLGQSVNEVEKVFESPLVLNNFLTKIYAKSESGYVLPTLDGEYFVGEKEFRTKKPPMEKFEGVAAIKLRFFEDKVSEIIFTYSWEYAPWKNNAEFITSISERLKIPASLWINERSLLCDGFALLADVKTPPNRDSGSTLTAIDTDASKRVSTLVQARRSADIKKAAEEAEQKKKAFKP